MNDVFTQDYITEALRRWDFDELMSLYLLFSTCREGLKLRDQITTFFTTPFKVHVESNDTKQLYNLACIQEADNLLTKRYWRKLAPRITSFPEGNVIAVLSVLVRVNTTLALDFFGQKITLDDYSLYITTLKLLAKELNRCCSGKQVDAFLSGMKLSPKMIIYRELDPNLQNAVN